MQLLSWPEAGIGDSDVVAGRFATETDHLFGEVADLYWVAHIQDEDLAVTIESHSTKNELARLGDGHEIAGDLRIGYRYRSTPFYLRLKQGYHASGGAEHIAEADRQKTRPLLPIQV